MHRAVLPLMAAAFLAVPLGAAAGAKGTVSSKGEVYSVVDGFAFESRASFSGETAIRVRLSERPLDQRRLAAVIDFVSELDRQRAGGPYVDLEFSPAGAWLGTSYQLRNTVCGFCADVRASAKAQVRIEGGYVKGTLRVRPADYRDKDGAALDLTLDLPVVTVPDASPLPAGGGDAGKAFQACWQLVREKNVAGVRQSCFAADDAQIAGTEGSVGDGFWVVALWNRESLRLSAPRITGGRRKGDWAELFVSGKDEQGTERSGSVFLRRGPGGWRFDHERLESTR
jgi:hypothetical protein